MELKALLREVAERAREARDAYRPAAAAMASGRVWTGPTARRWHDDLEYRHRRLADTTRQVTAAIEAELSRVPALVPESEADAIRRRRSGRL
nr:MAG: hypothetical protein DIU60_23760 [Actinomycetota bacterium]